MHKARQSVIQFRLEYKSVVRVPSVAKSLFARDELIALFTRRRRQLNYQLRLACEQGQHELAMRFVHAGADINSAQQNGDVQQGRHNFASQFTFQFTFQFHSLLS